VHLATHAYFASGDCAWSLGGPRAPRAALTDHDSLGLVGDNPLLLSGLALAGANHREEAGPEEEDGILTGEEIASLDLTGTQWVVLSACETGVGTVQDGEGILGLRRAFETAGAQTLIMSLWPVEDESARQWMRALYSERLAGQSTAESVRGAERAILDARRTTGKSTHPFFWGGFIAAGDWH
jgi:CHAT domain-containing protein